jgi:hypothetical protein
MRTLENKHQQFLSSLINNMSLFTSFKGTAAVDQTAAQSDYRELVRASHSEIQGKKTFASGANTSLSRAPPLSMALGTLFTVGDTQAETTA